MSRPAMASRSPPNDAVAARGPKGRLGAHAFPRPSGGALMSRGRSLLVAVRAAAPLAAQRPATLPRPLRGLDAYVTAALRTWDVPGLAVAVVKDDSVVWARGFGVRRLGDTARVTERTLFAIASCTKAFTATALAMQIGRASCRERV